MGHLFQPYLILIRLVTKGLITKPHLILLHLNGFIRKTAIQK